MTPEQEDRVREIRAEIEARWSSPEFEQAAMSWASDQLRGQLRKARAPQRQSWTDVGLMVLSATLILLAIVLFAAWLDGLPAKLHPGMHWVPQVNGHWEKDTP
jgi:hypothetical protein